MAGRLTQPANEIRGRRGMAASTDVCGKFFSGRDQAGSQRPAHPTERAAKERHTNPLEAARARRPRPLCRHDSGSRPQSRASVLANSLHHTLRALSSLARPYHSIIKGYRASPSPLQSQPPGLASSPRLPVSDLRFRPRHARSIGVPCGSPQAVRGYLQPWQITQ